MAVCPSCDTRLPRKVRAELAVREYVGCPACQYPIQLKKRHGLLEAGQLLLAILFWVIIGDLMWHEAIVLTLWLDTLCERYAFWRKVIPAWAEPAGEERDEAEAEEVQRAA